jgi:NhaP-type Na+/H+ and K+/H+ antiporter
MNIDRYRALLGAAVLLVAVVAVRLSARAGLPSLLVYLAIGVAIGESGLGIQFENVELTRILGFCALVVIIAGLASLLPAWRASQVSIRDAISYE